MSIINRSTIDSTSKYSLLCVTSNEKLNKKNTFVKQSKNVLLIKNTM